MPIYDLLIYGYDSIVSRLTGLINQAHEALEYRSLNVETVDNMYRFYVTRKYRFALFVELMESWIRQAEESGLDVEEERNLLAEVRSVLDEINNLSAQVFSQDVASWLEEQLKVLDIDSNKYLTVLRLTQAYRAFGAYGDPSQVAKLSDEFHLLLSTFYQERARFFADNPFMIQGESVKGNSGDTWYYLQQAHHEERAGIIRILRNGHRFFAEQVLEIRELWLRRVQAAGYSSLLQAAVEDSVFESGEELRAVIDKILATINQSTLEVLGVAAGVPEAHIFDYIDMPSTDAIESLTLEKFVKDVVGWLEDQGIFCTFEIEKKKFGVIYVLVIQTIDGEKHIVLDFTHQSHPVTQIYMDGITWIFGSSDYLELTRDSLITVAHELGHALMDVLNIKKYFVLTGIDSEAIEVPSMVMERVLEELYSISIVQSSAYSLVEVARQVYLADLCLAVAENEPTNIQDLMDILQAARARSIFDDDVTQLTLPHLMMMVNYLVYIVGRIVRVNLTPDELLKLIQKPEFDINEHVRELLKNPDIIQDFVDSLDPRVE